MIGSHVIVKMLKAYGVSHIFDVPGDTSISFHEALHDSRDPERQAFWKEVEAGFRAETTPLSPLHVLPQLNRHLHDPAVVIADAGTPTPYINRYLRLAA